MRIIGVTGGFGTGKTTVAGFFKRFGVIVLDADKIAHDAISPKGAACKKVLKIFGKKILRKDKEINRRRLGEIVFRNKPLLGRLCGIIHPAVIKDIKEKIKAIKKQRPNAVVILDIPLLVEAGLLDLIDKLIVVKADKRLQISRCRKKTGLSGKDILARIKAQMPIKEKIRVSDFIIDNSGTKKQTKKEVKKLWEKIQR